MLVATARAKETVGGDTKIVAENSEASTVVVYRSCGCNR